MQAQIPPNNMTSLSSLKRGTQIQTSFIKEEETNQVEEQFSTILPKRITVEMVKTVQMIQKLAVASTATMKKYTQELAESKDSLRYFVQNVDNLRYSMEELAEECNEGRAGQKF